jgi:hypothetical protein
MKRPFLRNLSIKTHLAWILIGLTGALWLPSKGLSQGPKTYHQVEIYLPFYNFMDGAPMEGMYSIGRKADAYGKGIRYSFSFKPRHTLSISNSRFHAIYSKNGPVTSVERMHRAFKLLNLDYHFRWLDTDRLGFDVCAGISRRRGAEAIEFVTPFWCSLYQERHSLKDWGMRLGIHAEYQFWKQLHLSLETNYTWYFHRYDHGQPTDVLESGTTVHQLALHLGLGYTFDKHFFSKAFWSKEKK